MRYGPIDRQIDIPQGVIDALADGTLAIFAGAGVSSDHPSNYPNFKKLAEEAGVFFGVADTKFDPIDQFFGRLDRAFPSRVHQWVQNRLSEKDSIPNPHHSTILRLFRSLEHVKIVTTNGASGFSV